MRHKIGKYSGLAAVIFFTGIAVFLFAACSKKIKTPSHPFMITATYGTVIAPEADFTPTATLPQINTPSRTITASFTAASPSSTGTITRTRTITLTPTISPTFSPSPFVTATPTATAGWRVLGMTNFGEGQSYPEAFASYNGAIYAAFSSSYFSYRATVWRYNGSIWEHLGIQGFTPAGAGSLSLKVYNGTPYLGFSDAANFNKITVMKYNGTTWENVGPPGFSTCSVTGVSLQIDSSGALYAGYVDTANGRRANVMKFDGTNWSFVGAANFTSNITTQFTLRLSASGVPYVGFQEYANPYNSIVMKYDGAAWVNVGASGIFTGIFNYMSFYVDGETPYAADGTSVKKFNGSTWDTFPAATYSASTPLSLWVEGGVPYIAYRDSAHNAYPSMQRSNGASWEYIGPPGFWMTGGSSGYSLLFSGGVPYVLTGSIVFYYAGAL